MQPSGDDCGADWTDLGTGDHWYFWVDIPGVGVPVYEHATAVQGDGPGGSTLDYALYSGPPEEGTGTNDCEVD